LLEAVGGFGSRDVERQARANTQQESGLTQRAGMSGLARRCVGVAIVGLVATWVWLALDDRAWAIVSLIGRGRFGSGARVIDDG